MREREVGFLEALGIWLDNIGHRGVAFGCHPDEITQAEKIYTQRQIAGRQPTETARQAFPQLFRPEQDQATKKGGSPPPRLIG